jgi:hypothetical protein
MGRDGNASAWFAFVQPGPYPEIMEHEIFVNCILLTSAIPPFLTRELVDGGTSRLAAVIRTLAAVVRTLAAVIRTLAAVVSTIPPFLTREMVDAGTPM